jgi:hypothetical protein
MVRARYGGHWYQLQKAGKVLWNAILLAWLGPDLFGEDGVCLAVLDLRLRAKMDSKYQRDAVRDALMEREVLNQGMQMFYIYIRSSTSIYHIRNFCRTFVQKFQTVQTVQTVQKLFKSVQIQFEFNGSICQREIRGRLSFKPF